MLSNPTSIRERAIVRFNNRQMALVLSFTTFASFLVGAVSGQPASAQTLSLCSGVSIQPAHPVWGQQGVTLRPIGSFGLATGTVSLSPYPGSSTALPAKIREWKADAVIVDLPTTAPATRIDRWHIQVTKLPLVACSTIADLIECKRAGEYFGEAWSRTVKARWPNGDVTDPPESLPLAKLKDGDRVDPPAVDMAIVRAQVANPLTKAIDDKSSGAGIRLGFSGPSDGIRYESGQLNAIWQADSPSLLGVRLRPNLVTGQKDAVDAGEFAATFQPVAKLKVPGCAYLNYEHYHNLFSLPAINLRQKPLILPTVAVFYEKGTAEGGADDGYEGDALVIVKGNASPAGSTLLSPGMKVDGCDATESELGRVLLALKVLGVQVPYVQETFSTIRVPSGTVGLGLDELGEAVNRMISNLEAALNHKFSIVNLDYLSLPTIERGCFYGFKWYWDHMLSSMQMIGIPGQTIKGEARVQNCSWCAWRYTSWAVGSDRLVLEQSQIDSWYDNKLVRLYHA